MNFNQAELSRASESPLMSEILRTIHPCSTSARRRHPVRRISTVFRLGLATAAVVIFGVTLWAWWISDSGPRSSPDPPPAASRYPAPPAGIRGFQFARTSDGQTVLHISSDAFRIQHKQMAYFRFGLLQEAVLHNARIALHTDRELPDAEEQKSEGGRYRMVRPLDWRMMSGLVNGRISSLRAAPVTIVFVDENGRRLSRIDAQQALARFNEGDIVVAGNVSIVAGDRRLTTRQIALEPEAGIIRVGGAYVWTKNGKRASGQQIVTDLALEPLTNPGIGDKIRSHSGKMAPVAATGHRGRNQRAPNRSRKPDNAHAKDWTH
jgi:hypothetical protein